MTCKDCIHWKACKDSAYEYYGEDAASAYAMIVVARSLRRFAKISLINLNGFILLVKITKPHITLSGTVMTLK